MESYVPAARWSLSLSRAADGVPDPVRHATYAASVPGCVHTDLMAAGAIDDPYLDDNEAGLRWIGESDWRYQATLEAGPAAGPDERVDLVFDGLDTVASVSLDGAVLGETRNMHRSHRFDVTRFVDGRPTELAVGLRSPISYAREQDACAGGALPQTREHPFNFIRKMACNFGWDWGPDLATSGIWRPVRLHRWRTARLARVRPLVRRVGGLWLVSVHIDVERADPAAAMSVAVEVAGRRGEVMLLGESTVIELEVSDVDAWWPVGYGPQPLYEIIVSLSAGDDVLDEWRRRLGFRTVELDTSPDDVGSRFAIIVNGTHIYARGVNWIPDDCFPHRVDRPRYAERLTQATAANVNLVRVWGGGIYESEDFYDLCDELGILVWQDFLFACAAYPEEQPLRGEVESEAREAVARLCSHPSLVLWNGNNECIWCWHEWDWADEIGGRTWGLGYYLELLGRVVAEVDPTRPYYPGSPYSGTPDIHPLDDRHGPKHIWDVWNRRDYTAYREHQPRFVAEFGYQGPPASATLARAIHDRAITPDSPSMARRQKATDGAGKLKRGLDAHFRAPESFDDWHYLTQLNQARALTLGVEHFRSLHPRCMGTIWWQLNDCWPVTSWSCVDGDGRRKPAWYALRRAYSPRLLTLQPGPELVLVNDSPQPWDGAAVVQRLNFEGVVLAEQTLDASCPAYETRHRPLSADLRRPADRAVELLRARCGDNTALWFFAEDVALRYPRAEYATAVAHAGDGVDITVTARTFLRDVCLFADRVESDAAVDDMLVTLLPGESSTFRVCGSGPTDALTMPPVLRCVNDGY